MSTQTAERLDLGATISLFSEAMLEQGIETGDEIVADGKLQRFHVIGDSKGSKNGWYCLHFDERPAGSFGCNKRHGDHKFSWQADRSAPPWSDAERKAYAKRVAEERAAKAEAEAERHAKAAQIANGIWSNAKEACDTHPYLEKKGVKAHGLKVGKWFRLGETGPQLVSDNTLLIPLTDRSRKVHSLQAIFPSYIDSLKRDKDFLPNGAKRGLFHAIGKPQLHEGKRVFVLCEGYATGASIHEVTGHAVMVCFDAGNLAVVAKTLHDGLMEKGNQATIILAADNDRWTTEPINNPGIHYATNAADAVGGLVVVPEFANLDSKPTDFNDLHALEGVEAVAKALDAALNPPMIGADEPLVDSELGVVVGAAGAQRYIQPKHRQFVPDPRLEKLKGSGRSKFLRAYYGSARKSPDAARAIFVYNGAIWELISDNRLDQDAAVMLDTCMVEHNPSDVKNIVDMLKIDSDELPPTPHNLVGFANGTFDMEPKAFREHRMDDWLTVQNGIVWSDPVLGENLEDHAPNMSRWLHHACGGSEQKRLSLLAGLFMVLTNQHSWQLFLALSGQGGSGKSVYGGICELLAGKHNVGPTTMVGLGGRFGLEPLYNVSLITMAEVVYDKSGEDPLKRITGGDMLMIDQKGKMAIHTHIRAVVVMWSNEPALFPDNDAGGISRRRVSFHFPEKVADDQKDPQLLQKIAVELPVLVRHLFNLFPDPELARSSLIEQRDGAEARRVNIESNPLLRFMMTLEIDNLHGKNRHYGMPWNKPGKRAYIREPKRYVRHAYETFCDFECIPITLSQKELMRAVKQHFGDALLTDKGGKNVTHTNLKVRGSAEYLEDFEASEDDSDTPI